CKLLGCLSNLAKIRSIFMISEIKLLEEVNLIIKNAIREDIGPGDYSSLACIPADATGKAKLLVKEPGVIAGVDFAKRAFDYVDSELEIEVLIKDGESVNEGDIVFYVSGSSQSILKAERLVLNAMQRMSAIATKTKQYVSLLEGTNTQILDTRKTTPGFRALEKMAVKIGGGENHRFALYDMVMLKDNHIDFAGGIVEAIAKTKKYLAENGFTEDELEAIEALARVKVNEDYLEAEKAEDPSPEDLFTHDFAPTTITEEKGERSPEGGEKVVMVDCALHAIEEIMQNDKTSLLYGQDVGGRLGGVFREAATLAQKFGDNRVFNTPIQEAFIIGSTVGMSAVGLKPIVEVQFADYIWPGLNQLFTEVSRSCYLSNGKWPVSMVLRVPIGAYGSGGPYHSSSVESVVTNIRGLKIAYPSNGADLKGLLKAAYHDPNPVVIFEHKGLYWSKVPGTKGATSIEPAEDYVLPFGKAWVLQEIWKQEEKETIAIVTYGMGVHWAMNASEELGMQDQIEVIDLRTLAPLDQETIMKSVKKCGKCLVVTEEPSNNTFARALSGKIQEECFKYLDAPVMTIGSENMPAIPLNSTLEETMIPSTAKVKKKIEELLAY
ncbi:carboxylating nicotinate-nucleotide diphosphorylase, partial [Mesonia mobilis]|uniref:carboxylating nicotinate-nucleotide diphosphorylase n=1 Tax=Mesonia mobilis TaxID=369791 RepID=UPI0026EFBFB6